MRDGDFVDASSFLAKHTEFVEQLDEQLKNLVDSAGLRYVKLVYNLQMGNNSAGISTHCEGKKSKTSLSELITYDLDYLFDRPIGTIECQFKDGVSDRYNLVEAFIRQVCLTTFVLRDQYCGWRINNLVSDILDSDENNPDYDYLAQYFCAALQASGFVIWHVCEGAKLDDGNFRLSKLNRNDKKLPENHFLHVLGSFPKSQIDMGLEQGVASYSLVENKRLRINDLTDADEVSAKTGGRVVAHDGVVAAQKWRSGVFIPMHSGTKQVGIVGVYSSRPGGFNNLDEMIAERCAEHVASLFLVHQKSQKNEQLLKQIVDLGKEIAAAQYTVFGGVHDSINLSNKIKDHIDLVKPTQETEEYFKTVSGFIFENSKSLGKLRDSVRDPKTLPLKIRETNLDALALSKLETLRVDAKLRGVKLETTVNEALVFPTDEFRLSVILFNLIQNSIRHFKTSKVQRKRKVISVNMEEIDGKLRVSVYDNGPGIDPEIESEMYQPFKTNSGGMGLGLSIVSTFVVEMNGEISHKTMWGKYTRFDIEFKRIS